MQEVNNTNFNEEVLGATIPVLVDFWAPGCPPCVALAPVLEKLATEFAGRVKIVSCNAAESNLVAGRWMIQGVPSLLFFHDGYLKTRKVGFQSESALRRDIEEMLTLVPA